MNTRALRPGAVRGPPARRLWAVAWGYAAYLGVDLVAGGVPGAERGWEWHELLVLAIAGGSLLQAARSRRGARRMFLWASAGALLLLMVAEGSYPSGVIAWRAAPGDELALRDLAYAAFLFTWTCAWTLLALERALAEPPGLRALALFTLVMAGFVALFAEFYGPMYTGRLGSVHARLDAAVAVLEVAALVAGMAVTLLGGGRAPVLMFVGVAVAAVSDMLYSEPGAGQALLAAADPVWTLGLFLLLAGTLTLGPASPGHDGLWAGHARHSMLSTLLLALSLGAVLLGGTVSQVWRPLSAPDGTPAVGELFFLVLLAVGLVVLMSLLTDRFDRAVRHAGDCAAAQLQDRLRARDWRRGDRRLEWVLDATGLSAMLDRLQAAAAALRSEVLFLGPERLLPPAAEAAPGAPPACFIVMPFGQPHSDAVHRVLREACQVAGLKPVRGDDLFTPSDILDDIWRSLSSAHCVIADISGRNPNVMYELGIAHALAKPVLILARDAHDIPIDLATRRVIVYGPADDPAADDWQRGLAERVAAALAPLGARAATAGAARR